MDAPVISYWSLNTRVLNRKGNASTNSSSSNPPLGLYYDLYRKSLDRSHASSSNNNEDSQVSLDVKGLCKFVGNLSYSQETIQNQEIHKDFMSKFNQFFIPLEAPKISKISARLLSSKAKKEVTTKKNVMNAERDQKLAKYNQLMAQSEVSQQTAQSAINFKQITAYNHASVLEIFQKPPHSRSKTELRFLFHNIKHLAAFTKLSAFTLEQLCGVINYCKFEADRVVFLQGDMGTSWYVILKGSVVVKVSSTGSATDAIVVKRIVAGEGFGDLALINDKPRAATIMTTEPCEFARIEKDDYNRILRFMHDREIKDRISFLRKIKQFESWNDDSLKTIAGLYEMKLYKAGSVIIRDKDTASHFFLIFSGICHGYRTIKGASAKEDDKMMKNVLVKKFEMFDYFGERSLKNDETITYGVTIKAHTDCEVVSFTRFDAGTRFKTRFESSKYLSWNNTNLLQLYQNQEEERNLHLARAKLLDGIIKERRKDPTVKYIGNMTEKEREKKLNLWKF